MKSQTLLRVPFGERDHARGPRFAPVQLVEYGDYECGYCRQAQEAIMRLTAEFADDLVYSWRQFPLAQVHPHALDAAKAAESAGLQGKFWRMHDALFEGASDLDAEGILSRAEELDLDIPTFLRAVDSPEIASLVNAHFVSGLRSGVNGTPTFYINNVRYEGAWSFEALLRACRDAWHETRRHTGIRAA